MGDSSTLMFSIIPLLMTFAVTLHMQVKDSSGAPGLGTCSGVWISETEVLTAGHCTDHKGQIWIKDDHNRSFSTILERSDKKLDLSILKIVNAPKHKYVHLGEIVERGDRIYTVNSGDDFRNTYNEGIVQNLVKDPENGTTTLLHSATILGGASGSGLFNSSGELVGINTATYHSISSAVDVTEVYTFLTGEIR